MDVLPLRRVRVRGKQTRCSCGRMRVNRVAEDSPRVVLPLRGRNVSDSGWSQPPNSSPDGSASWAASWDEEVHAVACPVSTEQPWVRSTEAYRREYKVAWTMLMRRTQSCRKKRPQLRSAAENAWLACTESLLSAASLQLAFQAIPELLQHPFLVWLQRGNRSSGRPFAGLNGRQKTYRAGLGTWNGDFGLVSCEVVTPDVTVMLPRLKENEEAIRLFDEFHAWWVARMSALRVAVHWALACEICEETLSKGSVRLHLHAGFRVNAGYLLVDGLQVGSGWDFRLSSPHWSHGAGVVKRVRNESMPLFYCQVEKLSTVFQTSNCAPHRDYHVPGEWAFGLLESNKITAAVARAVIIGSCRNVPSLLRNLDGVEQARRESAAANLLAEARTALASEAMPPRRLPSVEAWHALFDSHRWRYPFLVLDGPTRMGKTLYAQQQVAQGTCLMVDCSGAVEPDLRLFDPTRHRGIVFDEATAGMVVRKKRLFQAPPEAVSLGGSATNCHLYRVVVYRQRLIVCSNMWAREVAGMSPEDREWLEGNCIYVRVTSPLWRRLASAAH